MPPKLPPKKLSKKELKELEEQKKREEEEKRKKEEEEKEKQRQELERKRKLEEERLAAEEKARLTEEENELSTWRKTVNDARTMSEKKIMQTENWDKWTLCDSKPDPVHENQITTFITQYREQAIVKELKIEEALQQIQFSEAIVNEIIVLQQRALAALRMDDYKRYVKYINSIRDITSKKLKDITAHLSLNAEYLCDLKEEENKKKMSSENQQKGYKGDDKYKNEVYKIYQPLSDFRYGMWINPNTKQGYRHKPIEFTDGQVTISIQCEVPKTLMSQALIMKVAWMSYDHLSNHEVYNKDLIVGGVLDIECLQFLPPQKKGPNWTLKQDFEIIDAIKTNPYPAPDSKGQVNYQNVNPVKVFYTLPNYMVVYPNDVPRVALFEEKTQSWDAEHIDEVKYDADKKLLTFNTLKIAPFAYLQDRCTDYPYVSWQLRSVAVDKIHLDIQSKRDTFKFEITQGGVLLRSRPEPEFAGIIEKRMPGGLLLYQLQKRGIHLIPQIKDAQVAGLQPKLEAAESLAISDICQSVKSFFIESSKYTHTLKEDRLLCRIKENLEYDDSFHENQEKDWKSICWFTNKVAAVKTRESTGVNEAFLDDTVAHASLELLLTKHDLTNQEALNRMKSTEHISLQDTLLRFLKLTKIVSFTMGKK